MSKLWEWMDKKDLTKEGKIRGFLALNCIIFSILGFFVWLAVSRFALSTMEWAICFVGYPGFFIGYLGGILYLSRR